MPTPAAFGQFVALDEKDAPELFERMSSDDLPVAGDRYGISTRLIARASAEVDEVAARAVAKLLETTCLNGERVGAVVLSSRMVDPQSAADRTVDRLEIDGQAHGIERACSGFPAATDFARQLFEQIGRPVVIVAVEVISRNINWEAASGNLSDQHRACGQAAKLFADGAAAVAIGPPGADFGLEILDAWQGDVLDEKQLLQKLEVPESIDPWGNVRPGDTSCISMPGRRGYWLVKQAPQVMAEAIRQSLSNIERQSGIGLESLTDVVPHQANGLIVSALEKQLATDGCPAKVWNCLEHCGNTVSASIPLAMAEVQSQLAMPCLVAMPSVGAGGPGYRPDVLSTGCVLARRI